MNLDLTVPEVFEDIPERNYINDCCIGGDQVLNLILPDIASSMNCQVNEIDIYQEDWGWALEFAKDEVFYFLGLNNVDNTEDQTDFTVVIEANRKVKKFLFTKRVEVKKELDLFAQIISTIAQNKGFKIS